LERGRELACLRQALLILSDDKRELIVLARYEGMKHEHIADVLGIETGAVKVRIHRAMRELRHVFRQLSEGRPSCDVKSSSGT
jgi:RNA polymerase sigma-70 factor (ECF subfamily)